MSYKLSITKESGFLHVRMAGTRTREAVIAIAKEVVAACNEHKCHKILADPREMDKRFQPTETYKMASFDLPKLILPGLLRIAVVEREGHRDDFQFFENVSRNFGQDLLVFTDVDEASEWLNE